MEGTIVVTGANSSLGLEYAELLLQHAPNHTLILTVRNPSPESDQHTARLKKIIASHKDARAYVEALDLGSLAAVRSFADSISQRVASGKLPRISALVCNAFSWSLTGVKYTVDDYEASFQVTHLGHYLLVLKLLGSMVQDGQVVLLGSTAQYPENERPNPIANLSADFPDNIDSLIKPEPDAPGTEHARGFQRYGTAKLAVIMFMHDLNRRLKSDPKLSNIAVRAMDPGGLTDSRAHTEQRAQLRMVLSVVNFMMPIVKRFTQDVRKSADAAKDLLDMTTGEKYKGCRGYYEGLRSAEPAKASLNTQHQAVLWKASWTWCGLKDGETMLNETA